MTPQEIVIPGKNGSAKLVVLGVILQTRTGVGLYIGLFATAYAKAQSDCPIFSDVNPGPRTGHKCKIGLLTQQTGIGKHLIAGLAEVDAATDKKRPFGWLCKG